MTQIDRRKALALVAAVPAVGAIATVPILASAEDADLLSLVEHCKKLALETKRLRKLFRAADNKAKKALHATNPERWRLGYPVHDDATGWQVLATDRAASWFETFLDIDAPAQLPEKWINLESQDRAGAVKEARALDQKFFAEFDAKQEQAGIPFDRAGCFKRWVKAEDKLCRAAAQLARLKANTVKGLEMKAMVLALTYDAFDEPEMY